MPELSSAALRYCLEVRAPGNIWVCSVTQNPRTVWVGGDLGEHLISWAGTPSIDRVAQSSIPAWKGGRSELTNSTCSTLFCVHFNNHFSVTCSLYPFPIVSLAKMNLRYFQGVLVFRDSETLCENQFPLQCY